MTINSIPMSEPRGVPGRCACGARLEPIHVAVGVTLPLCPRCPFPARIWEETGRCPQCRGKGDIHLPGCLESAACKQFLERTPREAHDRDYWRSAATCYMQLCPACDGTGRKDGIRRRRNGD